MKTISILISTLALIAGCKSPSPPGPIKVDPVEDAKMTLLVIEEDVPFIYQINNLDYEAFDCVFTRTSNNFISCATLALRKENKLITDFSRARFTINSSGKCAATLHSEIEKEIVLKRDILFNVISWVKHHQNELDNQSNMTFMNAVQAVQNSCDQKFCPERREFQVCYDKCALTLSKDNKLISPCSISEIKVCENKQRDYFKCTKDHSCGMPEDLFPVNAVSDCIDDLLICNNYTYHPTSDCSKSGVYVYQMLHQATNTEVIIKANNELIK